MEENNFILNNKMYEYNVWVKDIYYKHFINKRLRTIFIGDKNKERLNSTVL